MASKTTRPLLALGWILGGFLGFAIAFVLAWMVMDPVAGMLAADKDAFLDRTDVFAVTMGLGFGAAGAGMATAQWAVVRRFVRPAGWWIAGSAAGFATLGALFVLVGELLGGAATILMPGPRFANIVVHATVGGLVAGYLQWRFVLKSRGVPAMRWIGVAFVAFFGGGTASFLWEYVRGLGSSDAQPIAILVVGVVSAIGFLTLDLGRMPTTSSSVETLPAKETA